MYTNCAQINRSMFTLVSAIIMIGLAFIYITPTSTTGTQSPASDNFGYYWVDSNLPEPTVTYNWIDPITGGTALTLSDDSNTGFIDLGFTFNYYGTPYTQVAICSNGWISFTSTSTTYSNYQIPSTGLPNGIIAPFWDDLNPGAGGQVYYKSELSVTPKRFIVAWVNVPHYYNTGSYTFEVILYENSEIWFQYQSMVGPNSDGSSATVGIENQDGSDGLQYSYNTAAITDNLAIRFSITQEPHDLAIINLDAPIYLLLGSSTYINATLWNYGLYNETDVQVNFTVNGILNDTLIFPFVEVNSYYNISFFWTPTTIGEHILQVEVTPVPGENITVNNNMNATIYVCDGIAEGTVALISDYTQLNSITSILTDMGLNYVHLTYNNGNYYTANFSTLIQYEFIIFYNYNRAITSAEYDALDAYLQFGGKLLVTGYDSLGSPNDNLLASIVRSSTVGNGPYENIFTVIDGTHPIMHGPYGTYLPGTTFALHSSATNHDLATANTALGAVTVAELSSGWDKIIATNLTSGGFVIYWNGNTYCYDWIYNPNLESMLRNILYWAMIYPEAHELVMQALNVPIYIYPGDTVNITATIWNLGLMNETDILVNLTINGMIEATEVINLQSGDTIELCFSWTPSTAGNYNISIYVVPVAGENYTANNYRTTLCFVDDWLGIALVDQTHGCDDINYYALLRDAITSDGYALDLHTTGIITAELLASYDAFIIINPKVSYGTNEINAIENFITTTDAGLMVTGYYSTICQSLTTFVGIDWQYFYGDYGVTSNINAHEVTTDVTTVYVTSHNYRELWLTSTDTMPLVNDTTNSGVILAISTNPNTRVAAFTDYRALQDTYITTEDNFVLATQMIKWLFPDNMPPSPPTELTLTDPGIGNTLELTWTSSPDYDLAGYRIWRSTDATTYSCIDTLGPAATTYIDTNLIDGTTYWYKLDAFDEVPNFSENSTEVSAVPSDTTPPDVTTGLTVTDPGTGTELELSWEPNPAQDLAGYKIYRATTPGFTPTPSYEIASVGLTTEYLDTGLMEGTTYYYRVRAHDEVPTNLGPASNEASGTPMDTYYPEAPSGLQVTDPETGNTLVLEWVLSTDPKVSGYKIYRAQTSPVQVILDNIVETVNASTSTYQDTNLVDGVTYYYVITAIHHHPNPVFDPNESPPSNEVTCTPTDKIPPSAPTDVMLEDISNEERFALKLTWSSVPESDLQGYNIYRAGAPDAYETITTPFAQVPPDICEYIDDTVELDTTYYYVITAFDEVPNESPFSIEVSCTVADFIPPAIPTWLTVEPVPEGNALYITWNANEELDFMCYRLYVATNIDSIDKYKDELYTLEVELPQHVTSYTDDELINGQTYYYRICAVDDVGNPSELSAPVAGVPQDIIPPAIPTGLKVIAIPEGNALELRWDPNQYDTDLAGYIIYWGELEGAEYTYETLATVDAGTTNYTHHGLTDGNRYYYQITAFDDELPIPNESEKSAVVSGVPTDTVPPGTPSGLKVTVPADKPNTLIISWEHNLEPDLIAYKLYYSTVDVDSSYMLLAEIPKGKAEYIHENLTPELTYYYKISAVDDGVPIPNESPRSAKVMGMPEAKRSGTEAKATGKDIAMAGAMWFGLIIGICVAIAIALIIIRKRKRMEELMMATATAATTTSVGTAYQTYQPYQSYQQQISMPPPLPPLTPSATPTPTPGYEFYYQQLYSEQPPAIPPPLQPPQPLPESPAMIEYPRLPAPETTAIYYPSYQTTQYTGTGLLSLPPPSSFTESRPSAPEAVPQQLPQLPPYHPYQEPGGETAPYSFAQEYAVEPPPPTEPQPPEPPETKSEKELLEELFAGFGFSEDTMQKGDELGSETKTVKKVQCYNCDHVIELPEDLKTPIRLKCDACGVESIWEG